jgi:hypothetical protein
LDLDVNLLFIIDILNKYQGIGSIYISIITGNILIIEANEMHYFSNLFGKEFLTNEVEK